jgi:hypothetical protein
MLKTRSPRVIGSVTYFILAILSYTILNPNWFTTATASIDPWIYWGAGDNPSLSFANDFGQTYYLQRYVVLVPQIVFNQIFGPYLSQLFVALFWLSLILISLSILLWNQKNLILIGTLLIFDRTFMGMIGYSYTQSASITFILCSLAFSVQAIRKILDPRLSKNHVGIDFFVVGIFLGLLSNAYLFLFMLFAPAMFLSILYFVYKKIGILEVYRYFAITLLGLILSLSLLQCVYFFITGSKSLYLLAQISFGETLISEKNPWGGLGGIQGLIEKIFDVRFLHWWFGIIILILVLALKVLNRKAIQFQPNEDFLLVSGFSISLIFLLSHFTYTNAIGYSWTALIMLVPQIIGMHLFLNLYLRSTLGYRISYLLLPLVLFVWIVFFFQNLVSKFFSTDLRMLSMLYLLFFGVATVLVFVYSVSRVNSARIVCLVFLFLLIISVNLSGRSVFLNFVGLSGAGVNASGIYSNVSAQRDILNELRVVNDKRFRIWLTPDNSTELLSAQLYGYSLVSTVPGAPVCTQVEWMASSPAVVASFNQNQNLISIADTYLKPCGYSLTTDNLEIPDSIKDSTLSVGILIKLP